MMKFLKALRAKLFTDRADSILVPALILIPTMIIVVGASVEVQKNLVVRSERLSAIQDAASAGVKTLSNSNGSLNWSVVDKIVDEYESHRFGGRVFSTSPTTNSNLTNTPETKEARSLQANGNPKDDICLKGQGADAGQKYPQYSITLEVGRGAIVGGSDDDNVVNTSRTQIFTQSQPSLAALNSGIPFDPKVIYKSVTVKIVDQAPNAVLGVLGIPCQKIVLEAGAVTAFANGENDRPIPTNTPRPTFTATGYLPTFTYTPPK